MHSNHILFLLEEGVKMTQIVQKIKPDPNKSKTRLAKERTKTEEEETETETYS